MVSGMGVVVSFPDFHFDSWMVLEWDSTSMCILTYVGFERVVTLSSDANGTGHQIILGSGEIKQPVTMDTTKS